MRFNFQSDTDQAIQMLRELCTDHAAMEKHLAAAHASALQEIEERDKLVKRLADMAEERTRLRNQFVASENARFKEPDPDQRKQRLEAQAALGKALEERDALLAKIASMEGVDGIRRGLWRKTTDDLAAIEEKNLLLAAALSASTEREGRLSETNTVLIKERDGMTVQVAAYSANCADLAAERDEVAAMNLGLIEERDVARAERDARGDRQLREALDVTRLERNGARSELANAIKERDAIEEVRACVVESCNKLLAEVTELGGTVSVLRAEQAETKAALAAVAAERDKLRAPLADYLRGVENECQKLRDECAQLRRERNAARDKLDKQKEIDVTRESRWREAGADRDRLTEEKLALINERDDLAARVDDLNTVIEHQRERIERLVEEIGEVREARANLSAENYNLGHELDRVRDERDEARAEQDVRGDRRVREALDAVQVERDEIESRLKTITGGRNQILKERNKFHDDLDIARITRENLRARFEAVSAERDKLGDTIDVMNGERDEIQNNLYGAKSSLEAITHDRDQILEERNEARDRLAERNKRCSAVAAQRDRLSETCKDLGREIDEHRKRLADVTEQRDRLLESSRRLTHNIDKMRDERNAANERLQEFHLGPVAEKESGSIDVDPLSDREIIDLRLLLEKTPAT